MKICAHCGARFTPPHGNIITCSSPCQQADRHAKKVAYRRAIREGRHKVRRRTTWTATQQPARTWEDVTLSMARTDPRLALLFLDALNDHRRRNGRPPLRVSA